MEKISKSDVKVSVVPNGLEKYMAHTLNKNLVFIDSMQFMNFSLDSLAKNLSNIDLSYLSQRFCDDLLKLQKQKGEYPYEYMGSSKKFFGEKLPDSCKFFSSLALIRPGILCLITF